MFAQVTLLHAPLGKMAELRRLIEEDYLPVVREREGFVAAHLLEQIDDPDNAQLILFWDTQAAVENMHRTGMLQTSIQAMSASMPGLKIRRQGYIVRVSVKESINARQPVVVS